MCFGHMQVMVVQAGGANALSDSATVTASDDFADDCGLYSPMLSPRRSAGGHHSRSCSSSAEVCSPPHLLTLVGLTLALHPSYVDIQCCRSQCCMWQRGDSERTGQKRPQVIAREAWVLSRNRHKHYSRALCLNHVILVLLRASDGLLSGEPLRLWVVQDLTMELPSPLTSRISELFAPPPEQHASSPSPRMTPPPNYLPWPICRLGGICTHVFYLLEISKSKDHPLFKVGGCSSP